MRTTEEAATYFAEQGCELLDEYTGAMVKMKYRCHCGEISHISWNNFTKGKRCGYCVKHGQKKKRSLEEVKTFFAGRGCQFLDDEFKGIHYKHRYRCKCGTESEISFAAFHFQQQYCRECGTKSAAGKNKTTYKIRGSNHYMWHEDREALRLKQLFKKKLYKMLHSTLKATGKSKVGHTTDMLGYTPAQLQEHIENHPNWPKVKDGRWHIDHLFPIEAFVAHGIHDPKLINCLDNLQPLTQRANNEKWAKYDVEAFRMFVESRSVILL